MNLFICITGSCGAIRYYGYLKKILQRVSWIEKQVKKAGLSMDEDTPHIEVRAVQINDAPAIYNLDYNFETDRIYTLHVQERLLRSHSENEGSEQGQSALSFKLVETPVDPPVYKNFFADNVTVEDV